MNALRPLLLASPLAVGLLAGCAPTLPINKPITEARWLDQNWDGADRYWYHHASQGTSTFPVPYKWFVALEQPEITLFGTPPLLIDPDYMRRFGFITSPRNVGNADEGKNHGYGYKGHSYAGLQRYGQQADNVNPDGLPVGFARTAGYTNPSTGQALPDQIGLTCAACHTGQLEYKGVSLRIDGGSATTDLNKLRTVLGLSLAYTKYVPGRFDRFAQRVLGPKASDADRAALREQLSALIAKGEALAKAESKAPGTTVDEGYTRLDALTRIGNTVFAEGLVGAPLDFDPLEKNYQRISAPVKFPHIWQLSWLDWVQYDGSIMQPMVRNAGEAMGVAAKVNTTNPARPLYASSVDVNSLFEMESLLAGPNPFGKEGKPAFKGLASPKWPADLLGALKPELVSQGRGLYQELCAGCHLPPSSDPSGEFWNPRHWTAPNAAGERYLKVKLIPVADIGTDGAQANILPTRQVQVPKYLGVDPGTLCDGKPSGVVSETSFAAALGYTVQKTVETWYAEHKTPPARQAEMNGYRPNCLQAKQVYKARPLDGIWATPPYLHNGAVPTLADLLTPVAERPTLVCLGSRQYDPVKVGYEQDGSCASGLFELDTRKPGNANTGHEFREGSGPGVIGRALKPAERAALLEYLKSI